MQGGAEGEAVDFEPEDDDLMDEDGGADVDASAASPHRGGGGGPKLKSAITSSSSLPKKTKGRGFRRDTDHSSALSASDFDSLAAEGGPGPQRCQLPALFPSFAVSFVD